MKMLVGLYLFISFSCLPFHDIKILDASSQKFQGGREESGSGIQYRIQLIANKDSEKLEIVGVWVDQKMYKPRIVVKSGFQLVGDFQKGDTLLLTFTKWTHKPEAFETPSEELQSNNMPPEKFKGEGIIEGRIKRKSFFKEIPHFIELNPKEYR